MAEKQRKVISVVKSALETEKIKSGRVDESVYRILKLKEKYELVGNYTDPCDIEVINTKIERLL